MKSNFNPDVLKKLYATACSIVGPTKEPILSIECVSIGELKHVQTCLPELSPKSILFTPNFAPKSEYEYALKLGVHVAVDNVEILLQWPELFRDKEIIVRIDTGIGDGHHTFVKTGGTTSKFGVSQDQLYLLKQAIEKNNTKIIGLHCHSGSGIFNTNLWAENANILHSIVQNYGFSDVHILDLGGGLGIPYNPDTQTALSLTEVATKILQFRKSNPQYQIWIEPGRFFVAQAGVILARVTQLKKKASVNYVGITAGMHTLIRPALYRSYHHIVNLSKFNSKKGDMVCAIVGPICESGDTLGSERLFPIDTAENDVVLIENAGAYGTVMSSNYNLRGIPPEYLLPK